jgi:hypothetical protein
MGIAKYMFRCSLVKGFSLFDVSNYLASFLLFHMGQSL